MATDLNLTLIYKTVDLQAYQYVVVGLFTNRGDVPSELIRKAYRPYQKELAVDSQGGLYAFTLMDHLDDFTMDLVEHLKAHQAYILSVEDYNVGLETANDKHGLQNIGARCGRQLFSSSKPQGKKDLVKRLFSR